ncbi:MAG: hypothetical protein JXM69_18045 [Anaerolineae bacterium]|nr:hypothetical protein [Anaerolineae bacterium]
MDTYLILLQPRGAHLGSITSQKLFGAMCWALDTLGMVNVGDLLAGFSQNPRFAFSSAFPFVVKPEAAAKNPDNLGPADIIRLFPKPLLPPITMAQVQEMAKASGHTGIHFKRAIKEIVSEQIKPVQQAAYVSEGLFNGICTGEWDHAALAKEVRQKVKKVGTALWLDKEYRQIWGRTGDPGNLWSTTDVQRNAVDRVAGSTAEGLLFHETQTLYQSERVGLWFAARVDAEAWGWLQAAFRYLADTGLGGKRTTGKGHFDFHWQATPNLLPDAPDADSFVTLSHYVPNFEQGQIEAQPQRYTLKVTRQKAENKFPGQEQRVYIGGLKFFTEGSVFEFRRKQAIYGSLSRLDEVNGRAVYYNGMAVPVFARLGGDV